MDADQIFTAITGGGFNNLKEAEQALTMMYIPDMTIPRQEICEAHNKLKHHYQEQQNGHH